MSRKFTPTELLESYRKILSQTQGTEKLGIEYNIEALESELEIGKNAIFNTQLPQNILSAKVYKEEELLKYTLEKILNNKTVGKTEKDMLERAANFSEQKLYFFRSTLNFKEYAEEALCESKSITGVLMIDVEFIKVNPVFKATDVEFYIDNVCKYSTITDFVGKIELEIDNAKDFELIIFDADRKMIAILFFPCEYFMNVADKKYRFKMYNAHMNAKLGFEQQARLFRKKAKIYRVVKCGHPLEDFKMLGPHYCCVCRKLIDLFKPAQRCVECGFACHKTCNESILFDCKRRPTETHIYGRVGFHIEHELVEDQSYGLSWCMHCGTRICMGATRKKCQVCNLYYHGVCSGFLFADCQVPLTLRQQTSKTIAERLVSPIHCTVSLDDFQLIKMIGRGSFGKVMLAKHKKENTQVALKMLKKEAIINENTLSFLELERAILEKISQQSCAFLMKMTHCFQDASRIYFATEYLAGGDLLHLLSKMKKLPGNIAKQYTCEILLGLEHLHQHNIIYRDLKLENVLISADGHAKIADFGLAKTDIDKMTVTYTFCGTIDTMAPEIFNGKGYTRLVDYWSLGCVIYSMYEGLPVFNGSTDAEIIQSIMTQDVVFYYLQDADEPTTNLITALLQKEPAQRLGYANGAEDIKRHPFFDVHWPVIEKGNFVPEYIPQSRLESNFDEQFIEQNTNLTPTQSLMEFDKQFKKFQ